MGYSLLESESPRCLECGSELGKYGRTDRKFCTNACRYKYHNDKNNRSNYLMRKTVNSLMQNHRILEDVLDRGFRMMDLVSLKRRGFSEDAITGVRKLGRGLVYECFDIEYTLSGNVVGNINKIVFG